MALFEKKHLDSKYSRNMDEVACETRFPDPEEICEKTSMISPEAEEEIITSDIQEEIVLPQLPEESSFMGIIQDITYWGFSQRGESHIKNELPCQDRCKVLVLNGVCPIIIAAIADGVGSCALSHYGASIATETSTEFLKKELNSHTDGKLEDKLVGDLLRGAMRCAYDAVKRSAEEMEQLEYSFQSTLTIALYDGNTLYISHAGDDGVVVITDDGKLELVTTRIKGEEASSVYPLQAGPRYWQVIKVDQHVNGFVMATDGVLDAFVRGEKEGNRIYYPFIQPAFETKQNNENKVKEVFEFYYTYMCGEEYRQSVTDDLTMIVVTNQRELSNKYFPIFDEEEWNAKTEEYQARVNAALYPESVEPGDGKNVDKNEREKVEAEVEVIQSCPYCGYEVDRKNKFCPDCGKKIQDMADKITTEKREIQIPQFQKTQNYSNENLRNYSSQKKSENFRQKSTRSVQKAKKKEHLDSGTTDKNNTYDWFKIIILIIIVFLFIVWEFKFAMGILFRFFFWW